MDAKLFALAMVSAICMGIGIYATRGAPSSSKLDINRDGIQWDYAGGSIATKGYPDHQHRTRITNTLFNENTIEITELIGDLIYTYHMKVHTFGPGPNSDEEAACAGLLESIKYSCIVERSDNIVDPVQLEQMLEAWGESLDTNNNPTFVTVNGVNSTETAITSVRSMEGGEIVGCNPYTEASDDAPVCDISHTRGRVLGWQEDLSNTDWCGAGTDIFATPCPGQGTRGVDGVNHACRRHDHGARYVVVLGGVGVRLECGVDRDLVFAARTNLAVQAAFGELGVSQFWGCDNFGSTTSCTVTQWPGCTCGWRGCECWGIRRRCTKRDDWSTRYGPFRYLSINDRKNSEKYVTKPDPGKTKECPGDTF